MGRLQLATPRGDSVIMEYATEEETKEANDIAQNAREQIGAGVVDDQGNAIDRITQDVQTAKIVTPIAGG